ncbi:MAG: hypothetical protein D6706_04320 [Chloroflexi bacterium]|nr:MAG: hypothetical protein D6706_04320 [Chloroflexota bacterium]
MNTEKSQRNASVPGVIATITAGFDLVTKHFWLVLLPATLDLFLWIGPRLSFDGLVSRLIAFWQQNPNLAEMATQLEAATGPTNLFTVLSAPLVGVPVLMGGAVPEKTPIERVVWVIDDYRLWFFSLAFLTVVGLFFTAVYFTQIARVVRALPTDQEHEEVDVVDVLVVKRPYFYEVILLWGRLLGLALFLFIAALVVYVPLMFISGIAFLVSPTFASFVVLVGLFILTWLIIYLSFSPQSMALNGRSLLHATLDSLRFVQKHLVSIFMLFLVIVIIRTGIRIIMLAANDGSWLTLGSILGHAFITTALTVATFIFYRDRSTRPLPAKRPIRG